MTSPTVTFIDIETGPVLGAVWGLWKQNVSLEQIHEDWELLSFSYAFGDGAVKNHNRFKSTEMEMLRDLHAVIDKSDFIVAHNGRKFDLPKINARLIVNNFDPPSPTRVIDTLDVAKRTFKFTSNKLQYLTQTLTDTPKQKHSKFPGYELWAECLKGNPQAWDEMVKYNDQDVISLRALYKRLRPWMPNHPVMTLYSDKAKADKPHCHVCGSDDLRKRGFRTTNAGIYQRYNCNDCKSWTSSPYTTITKKDKPLITRGA